VKVRRSMHMVR